MHFGRKRRQTGQFHRSILVETGRSTRINRSPYSGRSVCLSIETAAATKRPLAGRSLVLWRPSPRSRHAIDRLIAEHAVRAGIATAGRPSGSTEGWSLHGPASSPSVGPCCLNLQSIRGRERLPTADHTQTHLGFKTYPTRRVRRDHATATGLRHVRGGNGRLEGVMPAARFLLAAQAAWPAQRSDCLAPSTRPRRHSGAIALQQRFIVVVGHGQVRYHRRVEDWLPSLGQIGRGRCAAPTSSRNSPSAPAFA